MNTLFHYSFIFLEKLILERIDVYRVQYDPMVINFLNKNIFLKNTLVISSEMIVL